jgi:hypothetical protein
MFELCNTPKGFFHAFGVSVFIRRKNKSNRNSEEVKKPIRSAVVKRKITTDYFKHLKSEKTLRGCLVLVEVHFYWRAFSISIVKFKLALAGFAIHAGERQEINRLNFYYSVAMGANKFHVFFGFF